MRLDYRSCLERLENRLREKAPARIQLLAGPRQVGKTTLLLELRQRLGGRAIYAAADGPEAAVPGFWERRWAEVERKGGADPVVLLLDEIQHLPDWASRLKGEWDRLRRRRIQVHVVATGSSALHLGRGSRETLAGRFERLVLAHWSSRALAETFRVPLEEAVRTVVRTGSYPGAFGLRNDPERLTAYLRDAIVEPAIGRDILALAPVRKPALLRQVFAVCATSPAQIVSLQKIRGQLQDAGALETVAHYLRLLEEAFLVAPLEKHAARPGRQRAAPPKLVPLNNALLASVDPAGIPDPASDPSRWGAWVENACLAFAWNSGQNVRYWREEPYEVDAILDGSWGRWAVEITTGTTISRDVRGLAEFTRRYPSYRPLLLTEPSRREEARRTGFEAMPWSQFLLDGPSPR
jgi:predicted AAA+ superfamily ATPase